MVVPGFFFETDPRLRQDPQPVSQLDPTHPVTLGLNHHVTGVG